MLKHSALIDTILLGCTHYPLLADKIKSFLPQGITLLSQGDIVATSLKKYLFVHHELESNITQNNSCKFYTTDASSDFDTNATIFFEKSLKSEHIVL